jgi:D-glycero-D-manno-heptose 1,7-bisphosphate phosphatase
MSKPIVPPRAVFLDRDGTLIREKHYLHRPEDVEFFPGVAAALRRLQDAGYLLVIVTNQSGVGRGYFTMRDVDRVHAHIEAELAAEDVVFDAFHVAPEAPDAPSVGRKPSPHFLFVARDDLGVDLSKSYMIGDKLIDLQTGWNAGCAKSLLVRTGYGAETERLESANLRDAVVVDDLCGAAAWITSQEP